MFGSEIFASMVTAVSNIEFRDKHYGSTIEADYQLVLFSLLL